MKVLSVLAALAVIFGGLAVSHGALLTGVPMQGGMVDVGIGYDGTKLYWEIPTDAANIPALTPLSYSNPNDSFIQGDPWYTPLQGQAFTRRFSFNTANNGVSLPNGYTIWLEETQSSAGISAYYYKGSGTKACTPIFGTQSSPTLYTNWDLSMWHPIFAVPQGTTGPIYADFVAYLVDTNGHVVAGATSDAGVFNFTVVPEPATLALLVFGAAFVTTKRRKA